MSALRLPGTSQKVTAFILSLPPHTHSQLITLLPLLFHWKISNNLKSYPHHIPPLHTPLSSAFLLVMAFELWASLFSWADSSSWPILWCFQLSKGILSHFLSCILKIFIIQPLACYFLHFKKQHF